MRALVQVYGFMFLVFIILLVVTVRDTRGAAA